MESESFAVLRGWAERFTTTSLKKGDPIMGPLHSRVNFNFGTQDEQWTCDLARTYQ